jgi:uncharacterized membrane protein
MTATAQRASRLHPGWVFAALDMVGLVAAGLLMATSQAGWLPLPQIGMGLAVLLAVLAVGWAVTDRDLLADLHYVGAIVAIAFGLVYLWSTETVTPLPLVLVWGAAFLASLVRTHQLKTVHPGQILAGLDVVGLLIASYLSSVELSGGVPVCGVATGCQTVANSKYAWVGPFPVAVYGVVLSLVLLSLAVAWIRTNNPTLLDLHYGLSLIGVIFELYFVAVQLLILKTLCIWCASYGLSLIARFFVALAIWLRAGRFQALFGRHDEDEELAAD